MAAEGMASLNLAGSRLFESLGCAPVCLDFWHIPLRSRSVYYVFLFFRRNNHKHAAAFHSRSGLYYTNILKFRGEPLKGILAQFSVGNFTPAEDNGYLCLVTFFQESSDMFYLKLKVMFIGLRSDLNFLELYLDLFFPGFLLPLALLIFVFAVIHNPANGRVRRGGYFNKVQMLAFSNGEGLLQRKNTQLFAVGSYYPNFLSFDSLVDINCRFSYGATS
jgi:hypothetical protein